MALSNGKYKGAKLSLTIDSVEYNMDLQSANIVPEEADNDAVTFADLAGGGSFDWFLDIEAVSDYGTGSLWSYIWENAGDDSVAYLLKPYGNAVASEAQPHFSGTLTVPGGQGIGGSADEVFSFEARFRLDGKPTRVAA
jgi:hypothetical protein